MYYRYKSNKKNKRIYRLTIILIAIFCAVYIVQRYNHYILFWEYSYNKLLHEIKGIDNFDRAFRRNRLIELRKICTGNKEKNIVSAKDFFLSGRVHFQLGETYLNGSFSDILIRDSMDQIDTRALSEFTKAIKDIKKGIALCNRDEDIESLIILAKACFYTGFNNISEIYKITSKIELSNPLCKEEDIKFCSIICVYNGREKEGLELLFNRCSLSDSLRDLLFIATVNKIAKRYTSSILDYKRVLDKSSDNEIIKIVHINLGKIYFNQSLYQESLSHFYNASQIDKRDDSLKIWIGKNYSALGDRIKARAIWGEVLASDQSNVEAKRLLGLM